MGWISPIAFLLCHTYSIGDAATLETFSSKFVLSPERGALTGHFRKYLGFVCRAAQINFSHLVSAGTGSAGEIVPALTLGVIHPAPGNAGEMRGQTGNAGTDGTFTQRA